MTTETLSPMATLQDIATRWSLEGPYTIAELAERFEAEHPDLVSECLVGQRRQWLKNALRTIMEANRTTAERAVRILELSDPTWEGRIHPMMMQWPINDDNLWKALPNMTKSDLLFVAAKYGRDEEASRTRRLYFEGLAARLRKPTQLLHEVIDLDTLAESWAQVKGHAA